MSLKLKEMEHLRQVYRQTKWVLLQPVLLSTFTVLLPWYFIWRYELSGWVITLFWIWALLVALHLIRHLFLWYMNTYVITNFRLLHYDQTGLFNRTIIETPHERILNVSFKTEGLFSAIFGFGNVVVQVVGLIEPMIMKNVANPLEIKDYLWEMHSRTVENQNQFKPDDIEHIQERIGYTKRNQKL
ncbi:MAG TPA: PH domain-containing protein [Candidatus Doudnabacteria bacterium]|nr:PH domain-containing protein [Candidatus Doudnabacteria bacterium]